MEGFELAVQGIELLVVLVENVSVTLDLGNSGNLVDVGQHAVERRKDRACHQKLVVVTADYDTGLCILLQNGLNECLQLTVSSEITISNSQHDVLI